MADDDNRRTYRRRDDILRVGQVGTQIATFLTIIVSAIALINFLSGINESVARLETKQESLVTREELQAATARIEMKQAVALLAPLEKAPVDSRQCHLVCWPETGDLLDVR